MTAELDVGCCCCVAQGASKRFPGSTAGAPGARDSIHPVPHHQNVCVVYGPLDDGGVPEECQFPQGPPRGAPLHVCDGGPCVFVVRDSVREEAAQEGGDGGECCWCSAGMILAVSFQIGTLLCSTYICKLL